MFWRTAPYNYKGVLSFQGVSGMSIGIDIGRLILPKGMRIAARKPAPVSEGGPQAYLMYMPLIMKILGQTGITFLGP